MEEKPVEENVAEQTQPAPAEVQTDSKKKVGFLSKLSLPVVLGVLLLVGGGAAAFTISQQNSPEKIWEKALSTTAEGFDEIVTIAQTEPKSGAVISGDFRISGPLEATGAVEGAWQGSNLELQANVNASGIVLDTEVRAIGSDDNAPDIFLKINGLDTIDQLASLFGGESGGLSDVNDTWFRVPSSDIQSLLDSAVQSTPVNQEEVELTQQDLVDIVEASSSVFRDRLFTADESQAVVVVDESLGEEVFDGVDTQKYRVKVQQEQLKLFVTELKDALKATKLNDVLLQGSPDGQTFEEALDFDRLIEEIENGDYANASAEVWVDAKRKFIRNIRITDRSEESESAQRLDLSLNYDGGDVFPFAVTVTDETPENPLSASLKFGYNRETTGVDLGLSLEAELEGVPTVVDANLTVTPSDNEVNVEVPEGAQNYTDLLESLGFSEEILGLFLGGFGGSSFGNESDFQSLDSFDQLDFDTLPLDDIEL